MVNDDDNDDDDDESENDNDDDDEYDDDGDYENSNRTVFSEIRGNDRPAFHKPMQLRKFTGMAG